MVFSSVVYSLALVAGVASIWTYRNSIESPTVLYDEENEKMAKIVARSPSMTSNFWPFPLMTDPYLQTIIPSFIRLTPKISYTRELLTLKDAGTVALDWCNIEHVESMEAPTIILVCPGLTGTSQSRYILTSVNHFIEHLGTDNGQTPAVVVFNYRGNAGAPLTTPKSYNGSDTEDLREVVNHLKAQYPTSRILGIGFSLGSNILTKYIGEEGQSCQIETAISISNPFNFNKSTDYWNGWKFQTFLGSPLSGFLKTALEPHVEFFQEAGFPICKESIFSSNTIQDFDENFTIILGGWPTIEAYYDSASSEFYLKDIQIPMMFINAADDPLSPGDVAPLETLASNPNLLFVQTSLGGHIGWCKLRDPRGAAFHDDLSLDFFQAVLDDSTLSSRE